jgi:hypothetical protein
MSSTVVQLPNAATAAAQSPAIAITRVRFLAEVAPETKVLRVFREPRPCFAVEEAAEPRDLARQQLRQEGTDQLIVVLVPGTAAAEAKKFGERMPETADLSDASSTISIVVSGRSIQWQPGLALIQGRQGHGEKDNFEGVLAAVTDFAFYEGELRSLERALDSREHEAQADVARAYRIRLRDRHHWRRIGETIESLSQLRLTYARLESELAKAPRSVAGDARQVMTRLLAEAEVEARLEAASNRLEAYEDLYEGATDRIADYRWYLSSEWLEVGIIFLLVMEIVLLGFEIYRHLK